MSSFRTVEMSLPAFEKDGLRFITVKSANLKGRGDICVYVPDNIKDERNLPVYVLLHGVYGSAWSWALKAGAHKTAHRLMSEGKIKPAIIAMPSDGLWGDGSGYFSHHDLHFDKWIVEDVPLVLQEQLEQVSVESKICIGGLSMGGYGALHLGATYPNIFSAISGHSSITELDQMTQFVEEPLTEYTKFSKYPNVIDTMKLNKADLPPLRFDCGLDDNLIEANRLLHNQLNSEGIDHTFQEFSGKHEWPYWEAHVAKTFIFFDHV